MSPVQSRKKKTFCERNSLRRPPQLLRNFPISIAKSMFQQLSHRGRHLLRKAFSPKYLLLTNVAISVSLSGVGDIIEQHYEILKNEAEKWDRLRTHQMSISGMTVGVFCHNWYKFLDRHLPGRTIQIVMKKVVIDQLVASPIVIMLFFLTLGWLKRSSLEEIQREIRHKALRLYTAEWTVWPPAQIINFYLLPNKYRVLYDNTISLGYDVYTSYVINEKIDEDS